MHIVRKITLVLEEMLLNRKVRILRSSLSGYLMLKLFFHCRRMLWINWSHFGPTSAQKCSEIYNKEPSAENGLPGHHNWRRKSIFCKAFPDAFRAVYNCIFPECYFCTVSISKLDWSLFWFQLLITTKLLSMACPLWGGNHREGKGI